MLRAPKSQGKVLKSYNLIELELFRFPTLRHADPAGRLVDFLCAVDLWLFVVNLKARTCFTNPFDAAAAFKNHVLPTTFFLFTADGALVRLSGFRQPSFSSPPTAPSRLDGHFRNFTPLVGVSKTRPCMSQIMGTNS